MGSSKGLSFQNLFTITKFNIIFIIFDRIKNNILHNMSNL